ncbi:hypothetical protein EYF80_017710 [Liparis tanakae]|uniref:Uncharacterized protein n=1 Tax=Liparis tanakae TaxID=230148 RepID=A0A4Z2I4G9_9TELE|nr:hypothetical protein EYF80_017710 [Liparis tanakae]
MGLMRDAGRAADRKREGGAEGHEETTRPPAFLRERYKSQTVQTPVCCPSDTHTCDKGQRPSPDTGGERRFSWTRSVENEPVLFPGVVAPGVGRHFLAPQESVTASRAFVLIGHTVPAFVLASSQRDDALSKQCAFILSFLNNNPEIIKNVHSSFGVVVFAFVGHTVVCSLETLIIYTSSSVASDPQRGGAQSTRSERLSGGLLRCDICLGGVTA